MSKTIKIIFSILSGILIFLAVIAFVAAFVVGCQPHETELPKVQIYINDNDSIINQLQRDITKLTRAVERMETGYVTIEIKKSTGSQK